MRFIPKTHKLGPVEHMALGTYVPDRADGSNPQVPRSPCYYLF